MEGSDHVAIWGTTLTLWWNHKTTMQLLTLKYTKVESNFIDCFTMRSKGPSVNAFITVATVHKYW